MGQPAARVGDMHTCPMVNPGPVPHVGGPVVVGCPTVLIGGAPAARVGDMLTCVGPPDAIASGASNVLIGGMPAARMGDSTAHGGVIVVGNPTVLIGEDGGSGGSTTTKKVMVCGGPYYLIDPEEEGDRRSNNALVIEVVPESQAGGDKITVKAQRSCSCSGAEVVAGSSTAELNDPFTVGAWTMGEDILSLILGLPQVGPKIIPVKLSCQGPAKAAMPEGEIRIYPSDKVTIKAESTKELAQKIANVAKMLQDLSTAISTVTGKQVDLSDSGLEIPLGPSGLYGSVEIPLPTLSLEYESQWKEYQAGDSEKQWQAYYAWKFNLNVTISIALKIDVLMVGATAAGVPEPVVSLCQQVLNAMDQKDPLVFLELSFSVQDQGSIGCDKDFFGSLQIEGRGSISLGMNLNVKDVLTASFEASTAVTGSITGKGSKSGLEAEYELLKWEGVEGKASITLDTRFWAIGFEKEVTLISGGGPLSKGKLWPPNSGGGGGH